MQEKSGEVISQYSKTNEQFIEYYIRDSVDILRMIDRKEISKTIDILYEAWKNDKQIFFFGNGGSASTASHFCSDLFKTANVANKKRFRAFCLNDNMSVISAFTNDAGWENIYQEQLVNLMNYGDVAIALSVHGGSGKDKSGQWSQNILKAIDFANKKGKTIGFSGFDGGPLKEIATACVVVPKNSTAHVEAFHVWLQHLIVFCLKKKIEATEGFEIEK
jgi:D-sedoheptulose 7-phosphate isomerase